MAVKIIPRKSSSAHRTNEELEVMIAGFPKSLTRETTRYLEDRDIITDIEISHLRIKNWDLKEKYVQDLLRTYEAFMTEIMVTQNADSKQLRLQITGEYDDNSVQPTVEYWGKCNPGKMAAINHILTELELGGWQPVITGISAVATGDVSDPTANIYSGGNLLIITCDFTE
jgi:hypothetical protein